MTDVLGGELLDLPQDKRQRLPKRCRLKAGEDLSFDLLMMQVSVDRLGWRATAIGRELLGFIWAIGTTAETAAGPARGVAAQSDDERGTPREVVAIEWHTNRRTLVVFYAAGLRARSARLVRGSSRLMTTMRSRPAYIRVINRRRSRSIATHVASPESETTRRYWKGLTGRSISEGRCSIQLSYGRSGE